MIIDEKIKHLEKLLTVNDCKELESLLKEKLITCMLASVSRLSDTIYDFIVDIGDSEMFETIEKYDCFCVRKGRVSFTDMHFGKSVEVKPLFYLNDKVNGVIMEIINSIDRIRDEINRVELCDLINAHFDTLKLNAMKRNIMDIIKDLRKLERLDKELK